MFWSEAWKKEGLPGEGRESFKIHAPVKGATIWFEGGSCNQQYFNPHTHEEHDVFSVLVYYKHSISIHALFRGETIFTIVMQPAADPDFNPLVAIIMATPFQPTPL